MEGISENLELIFEKIRESIAPIIQDKVEELQVRVVEEFIPKLKKFVEDLLKSRNVKYETVDMLTKSDMISLIRLNMIKGSNGVAAFRQPKDDKMLVYLAYCKDKELLPEDTNCYIVIEAKFLANDVNVLFKDSDLIILN